MSMNAMVPIEPFFRRGTESHGHGSELKARAESSILLPGTTTASGINPTFTIF
jgi:hypothetical protein